MAPLRGLPFLLREGMSVALTPPALKRDRFTVARSIKPWEGDQALVRFDGARSLQDSEALVGCWVLAHAEDLDIDALTCAVDSLLGRAVVDDRFGALGTIAEVMETPANNVWVLRGSAHGEVLMPVIPEVLPQGISSDGPIAVHIMDGLLDL